MSFIFSKQRSNDPPLQYSMMMQRLFCDQMCALWQLTRFQWFGSYLMICSSAQIECRLCDSCKLMILATSCWPGLSLLYALQTSPQLPFPNFSSQDIRYDVPYNLLTLTLFLLFISINKSTNLQCVISSSKYHLQIISVMNNNYSIILTAMSRVNQTTLSQNSEIRKIYCAYHPNEFLTNFCCDSECLMPLCPNCIVEHTQQHFLQNNKPAYVNLQEIITQTKQKCYQHIIVFEELNKSNDKIFDYLVGLRESIHNQLMQDKQEIIKELDSMFQAYEDKLFTETANKYKDLQVFDKKETVNITQFISDQIETLHEQISILKGENCLAGLITYFANDGKIYEESIKELNEYVSKHKKAGKILINTDPEKLVKTFEGFCENNIVTEFINQEEQRKQQQIRLNQSRASKEGNSILGRLGRKNHGESISKENNINQSNSDYKNMIKRSQDFYKIDPAEGKYSRTQQSKASAISSYSRPNIHLRYHY